MSKQSLNNIHPKAIIGNNVTISPFVTIEEDVIIGDDTWIGPCAALMNGTRIGQSCKIFPGAIIGAAPQDLKFTGETSTIDIGNHVIIREYCTLNRGTKASHKTIVKDNALVMAYVHIAHDCIVGKNCILANNVTLAGHIEVGDWAVLGGMVAVHQFVRIGEHAMIGGGSLVRKDVPPFVKAAREPLSYVGINSTGMRRRGFTKEQLANIQDIYRILFIKNANVSQAKVQIQALPPSLEKDTILNFINKADRGIMKGFQKKIKVEQEM